MKKMEDRVCCVKKTMNNDSRRIRLSEVDVRLIEQETKLFDPHFARCLIDRTKNKTKRKRDKRERERSERERERERQ